MPSERLALAPDAAKGQVHRKALASKMTADSLGELCAVPLGIHFHPRKRLLPYWAVPLIRVRDYGDVFGDAKPKTFHGNKPALSHIVVCEQNKIGKCLP